MDQPPVKPFWSSPPADLLAQLGTSPQGLSPDEARQRLDQAGANLLRPKKRTDSLTLLLAQYKSPIILILVFACLLSFALGDHADALIILAIVLVSGLLGFWQERGATNAVAKLLAIVQIKATVRATGRAPGNPRWRRWCPATWCILDAGRRHPRRLPASWSPRTCSWTKRPSPARPSRWRKRPGSWRPDTALAKRTNAVFMGTHVVSGAATRGGGPDRRGHRVRPGLGATEAAGRRRPSSNGGSSSFGYFLMEVTLMLVIAIFAINVYLHRPVLESFLFSLALAVGLTPQLLPAIISINLAMGAKRMARGEGDRQAPGLHRKLRQHERAVRGQDRHPHRRGGRGPFRPGPGRRQVGQGRAFTPTSIPPSRPASPIPSTRRCAATAAPTSPATASWTRCPTISSASAFPSWWPGGRANLMVTKGALSNVLAVCTQAEDRRGPKPAVGAGAGADPAELCRVQRAGAAHPGGRLSATWRRRPTSARTTRPA